MGKENTPGFLEKTGKTIEDASLGIALGAAFLGFPVIAGLALGVAVGGAETYKSQRFMRMDIRKEDKAKKD